MDSSKKYAVERVSGSNARLSRKDIDKTAQLGDPFHPHRPISPLSSERSSGEMQSENEQSRDGTSSPDTTPKRHRRTFVFSSAFVPPVSRGTTRHLGPSLDPSHRASHAFGPPAHGFDYNDLTGASARARAPTHYQALPTPVSETGSTPEIVSRFFSEPELSIGSDVTEEQRSLQSEDLLESPFLRRVQPGREVFENAKEVLVGTALLRDSAGTELSHVVQQFYAAPTPPDSLSNESLSPVVECHAGLGSLNARLAHLTSPYISPPLGTFRSSHARRLRSETYAEVRDRAARREERRTRSDKSNIMSNILGQGSSRSPSRRYDCNLDSGRGDRYKGRENGDGYATDVEEDDDGSPTEEHKEDIRFKEVVLGISELDIFGVGAMKQNMDKYTSFPWKRSVRAPKPRFVRSRQSIPSSSCGLGGDRGNTGNGISGSAPS